MKSLAVVTRMHDNCKRAVYSAHSELVQAGCSPALSYTNGQHLI